MSCLPVSNERKNVHTTTLNLIIVTYLKVALHLSTFYGSSYLEKQAQNVDDMVLLISKIVISCKYNEMIIT